MATKSLAYSFDRVSVGPCQGSAHTRVVTACCVPGAPVLVRTDEGTFSGTCSGPLLSGWLRFQLDADVIRRVNAGSVGVLVHGTMFQVTGDLRWQDHRSLELWPREVYCVAARGVARVAPAPSAGFLHWYIGSGVDSKHSVPIVDFSCDGIGVMASPQALPKQTFPVLIELGNEKISALAEVRSGPEDNTAACSRLGLRLVSYSEREKLLNAYLAAIFPRFTLRSTHSAEAITRLFVESGYLDLRANTRLPEDWLQLPQAERLSRDVVYTAEDGTTLGHVSTTRAYRTTWLGQQLATLRGHPDTPACRLSLYRHMAIFPYAVDGPNTHLLCYFNRSKRWHRAFFDEFVKWVEDDSKVVIAELDRFEPQDKVARSRVVVGSDITIEPLGAMDTVAACAMVRSLLPELVCNAWDIHPEHLQCSDLHPDYVNSPYRRGRHVLTVRHNNQLVGLALCELTSRDLSLFNVLNMAQLFFVSPEEGATATAQAALIQAARDFFLERGEEQPLLVSPAGCVQEAALGDLEVAERMGCIVMAGQCLPFYDGFLNFQVGNFLDSNIHA